jgi:hypothetical protein
MNLYFLSLLDSCRLGRRESIKEFHLPNGKLDLVCSSSQPLFSTRNGKKGIMHSGGWGYITIYHQGSKIIYYRFPERIVIEDKKGKFKAIGKEDKFMRENYLGRLILLFFS